jgi:hypothetical protein
VLREKNETQHMPEPLTRRSFARFGALAGLGLAARAATVPLFDGRTLAGWTQVENNATLLRAEGVLDPAGFIEKIATSPDAIAEYLRKRLSNFATSSNLAALLKELNETIAGPSIYDRAAFAGVVLRPQTAVLLAQNLKGQRLARLNKMLLEDAFPRELARSVETGWVVKDSAMASTGSGRGVIYSDADYARFRLLFTMRHVSGNPDHQACVLIFCSRPAPDEKPLDALGGIQFQPPNGGRWDYLPGRNNNGGDLFTLVKRPGFDPHQWSRVEILADASRGTARMAVAQPIGSKGIEVLRFEDQTAGKPGPIAWQMHNAGLFDEYRDAEIETDPRQDSLLTIA